jgi:hypothetical protein
MAPLQLGGARQRVADARNGFSNEGLGGLSNSEPELDKPPRRPSHCSAVGFPNEVRSDISNAAAWLLPRQYGRAMARHQFRHAVAVSPNAQLRSELRVKSDREFADRDGDRYPFAPGRIGCSHRRWTRTAGEPGPSRETASV